MADEHSDSQTLTTQERHRNAARRWKKENRERNLQIIKEWKLANPEAAKQWHIDNREQSRAACRRYYEKNRAAMIKRGAAAVHERRARKKQSGGKHTAADLAAILRSQNNRCAYCSISLRKTKKHVDHIVPLSRGGSNDKTNLQYLCAPCNLSKGAKDPVQFAQELGRLI